MSTRMIIVLASLVLAALTLAASGPEIVTRGEVVAISADDNTITIEESADPAANLSPGAMQSGVQRDFLVNDATKLTENEETIELSDIKIGADVIVRYVMHDGMNVALEIDLRSHATD